MKTSHRTSGVPSPIIVGYAIEPGKRERFFNGFVSHCQANPAIPLQFYDATNETSTGKPGGPANVFIHKLKEYASDELNARIPRGARVVDPIGTVAALDDRAAAAILLDGAFVRFTSIPGDVAGSHDQGSMADASVLEASGFLLAGGDETLEISTPPHAVLAPFMAGM